MNLLRKRQSLLLLFTIPLLLSCQLLSRFQSSSTESPQATTEVFAVIEEREPATAEPSQEPATIIEPTVAPTQPAPSQDEENQPPPLPANNLGEGEDNATAESAGSDSNGATIYKSPAGYELSHFADWFVADYFGQTIISNNEAALEQGGDLINQPIILIASGNTNGQSAAGLLNAVQRELLIDGQLAPVSPVSPINRPSASGVRSVQRLILPEGNMEVTTEALINGDLYTVAIGLLPEGISQNERDSLRLILESITHTANTFSLTAADYGLTADGVTELNQSLFTTQLGATQTQEIDFGVNQLNVEPGNSALLPFTLAEQADISIVVSPSSSGFDLTVDLQDGAGESILQGGLFLDNGGAGSAERLEDIQLEAGTYTLVVRGFGLTGGSFSVELR